MKDIPVHQLKERVSSGLDIWHFVPGDEPDEEDTLGAHRDDHYIFFVLESGSASLMVDFQEFAFVAGSLYYLLPGQVHHRINAGVSYGWFLAVDSLLVTPDYQQVFEDHLQLQQPFSLNPQQLKQCQDVLSLLYEKYFEDDKNPFYLPVVHSLLQSFVGMAAGCYSQLNDKRLQSSRPSQLAQQFKKLLALHIRKVKSPSAYAGMLNVSETYLNEALKKITGFSVSYWIQQEVILEAKRLLYYTEMNVKEIAHDLGYEDHAYFSRLFKKAEGITPLSFRSSYRK
ncbi:AraC-type DNA-binding protein [Mucilaginibacter pineti]|uniref:AraC-type DNA-binding protein n=1 Tax=Mucilaginibacter pineti TaxID=1391627 RepID=A0A1G7C0Q5_9SPHI|nr:AraC family transcriptional regulator [Mucilaginibacter pineti]SDE32938.1 AraC-type DNA-binding protein [Mucilaginibacter pineti]